MDENVSRSNQLCVSRVWNEFDDQKRMKPSFNRSRVADVAEELYKLTALSGPQRDYLLDRYSEREKKIAEKAEIDKLSLRSDIYSVKRSVLFKREKLCFLTISGPSRFYILLQRFYIPAFFKHFVNCRQV